MNLRRCSLVLALLLLPGAARAELHDRGLSAGLSYAHQSHLLGGYFVFESAFMKKRPEETPFTWVTDFSYQSGPQESANLTQFAFLAGIRHTGGKMGKHQHNGAGVCPIVHVLVGAVHARSGGEGRTHLAGGAGLGLDILFSKHGGLRLQGDFIATRNPYPRFSVGLVYRFEKEHKP